MKKFSPEELRSYDGSNGKVYVAFQGKVYDVSDSYLWEDGQHQDQHEAGRDLTDAIQDEAPHDPDVLENFPVIGELDLS